MSEGAPQNPPPERPTWEEVLRTQEEWREARTRFRADAARNRAELRAAIDLYKRNEELAAQRRCWLF
jgi:hypothetical protein